MENPVVAFVLKEKCNDKELVFPTGWTAEGERLNGEGAIRGKNCCVILLADDQEIPTCDHANRDVKQALLVITHINSGRYKAGSIANTELAKWGTPVCREFFSHDPVTDRTFNEILKLLNAPSSAESFAQQRLRANDLEALDKLAAICQICIIDPDTGDNIDSWGDHFNQLPTSGFKDQLRNAMDKATGWPAMLEIIVARANALSSQPPA